VAFDGYGYIEAVWIDEDRNRRRYYRISVEPGLFGPIISRTWGRIGARNLRQKEHLFSLEDFKEALKLANSLLTQKLQKGYQVASNCTNNLT